MRTPVPATTRLFALGLVFLATPVLAADLPVKVAAVRVGFVPNTKPGEATAPPYVAKFGCWAPLHVDLELTAPIAEPAELVIESPDADEITTTLAVPINLASASGKVSALDLGAMGYVRPSATGEILVTVRKKGGGNLSEPFRLRTLRPRDALTYVVLSLGSTLPGFDLPKPASSSGEVPPGLRGGRIEVAAVTDVSHLPTQWYGYEAADLVVINTSATDFWTKLFGAGSPHDPAKRSALLEWVRRGGRVVVAGSTHLNEYATIRDLLPFEVKGTKPVTSLPLYWSARESSTATTLSGLLTSTAPFPVANLVPSPTRAARVAIPTPDRRASQPEIIAGQAGFGLGRVTMIGFDLDREPFTEFPQRAEFWDWVLRDGGANRASVGSDGKPKPTGPTEEEDELATALRTHSDTFDGVAVVSFGWIAVLIVFYILLIGPVEYFFLKRVLGRLELTWVTFPLIVLTVSLAVYYSAYSLKGRELRVNKIDIVDVDAAGGRVYGTTRFTIFSPRIDTYTIGVTPGEGWGEPEPGTEVTWVGGTRGGRASLLGRKYAYHTDSRGATDGLEKVPIQVWSTKSFEANWSSRLDPGSGVEAQLEHPPGDPATVIGTFVNRLPVPALHDCVAFYAGTAYPLPGGTIHSGDTVRLVFDKGVPAHQWLQKESRLRELFELGGISSERAAAAKVTGAQPAAQAATPSTTGKALPLLGVLFHESALTYSEGVIPRNASLRRLDQSWRLTPDNRNEVVIVGRVAPPVGDAEGALSGPSAASRLWLKGLPGSGDRTPIPGTGRQETWVRVYLPVR